MANDSSVQWRALPTARASRETHYTRNAQQPAIFYCHPPPLSLQFPLLLLYLYSFITHLSVLQMLFYRNYVSHIHIVIRLTSKVSAGCLCEHRVCRYFALESEIRGLKLWRLGFIASINCRGCLECINRSFVSVV